MAQNLFEADEDSGNIYEFTTNGAQSTFVSGLSTPAGLAFDSAGDLFVSSFSGNVVYEFANSNGRLSTTPVVFASSLNGPFALAFYDANLFVANSGTAELPASDDIVEISLTGAKAVFSEGLPSPMGLAIDSSGNVYALCYTNTIKVGLGPPKTVDEGALIKITPGGTKSTFANGWTTTNMGVAINNSGDILMANYTESGSIAEYTSGGSPFNTINGLNLPRCMVCDNAGNLYVSNLGNNSIVRIAANGSQTTFASGLDYPAGLAFQPPPALRAMNAGIETNKFGFTIVGSNSEVVVVQCCTNLANPVWLPQTTNTLSGESFYFSDPQWTNWPSRFYRLLTP